MEVKIMKAYEYIDIWIRDSKTDDEMIIKSNKFYPDSLRIVYNPSCQELEGQYKKMLNRFKRTVNEKFNLYDDEGLIGEQITYKHLFRDMNNDEKNKHEWMSVDNIGGMSCTKNKTFERLFNHIFIKTIR